MQAHRETSKLYRFGGQWKFNYFDPSVKAWRESVARDYSGASSSRRRHLIERAREILHGEMEVKPCDFYTGGRWQDFVY